ncbi:hypothetical protein LguiB_033782 [Lonicera macranthoides]
MAMLTTREWSSVCPTIGVGGHFSSGGYGMLSRKHGIAIDHIIDAQLVDVNGQIIDRESLGEDLFWAIRGGGHASFRVIIEWKINSPKLLSFFPLPLLSFPHTHGSLTGARLPSLHGAPFTLTKDSDSSHSHTAHTHQA